MELDLEHVSIFSCRTPYNELCKAFLQQIMTKNWNLRTVEVLQLDANKCKKTQVLIHKCTQQAHKVTKGALAFHSVCVCAAERKRERELLIQQAVK